MEEVVGGGCQLDQGDLVGGSLGRFDQLDPFQRGQPGRLGLLQISQSSELLEQVDRLKTERNSYLWEVQRLEPLLEEARRQIQRLKQECKELEPALRRAVENAIAWENCAQRLEQDLAGNHEELARTRHELECSEQARLGAEKEREEIRAQLADCREASLLEKTRGEISSLKRRLGDVAIDSFQLRERMEKAEQAAAALKEENLTLRLEVASLRDKLGGAQLEGENQRLRGILERNNEQLRGLIGLLSRWG